MLNGGNAEYRVSLSKCTLGRILSSPDAGKRKECSTFTREKSEKEGSGEIERRAKSRSTETAQLNRERRTTRRGTAKKVMQKKRHKLIQICMIDQNDLHGGK